MELILGSVQYIVCAELVSSFHTEWQILNVKLSRAQFESWKEVVILCLEQIVMSYHFFLLAHMKPGTEIK